MFIHDDPPEFTGTEAKIAADPVKGKRAAPVASPVKAALAEELASPHPGTPKAIYEKPTGPSHPHHAIKSVAEHLDAAEVALNAAHIEERLARENLRVAEQAEVDALDTLTKLLPGPTYAGVNAERLAREQTLKLERVAKGLPAVPPKPVTARSPIDLAASQRPRTSPQAANVPLRSPVVRRVV